MSQKYKLPKNFPECKSEDLAWCGECSQFEDCSDECNCRCQDYTPYSDEDKKWEQWWKDTGFGKKRSEQIA